MAEIENKIKLTPTQRFWRMIAIDAKEIRNVYYYAIFTGLVSLSLPLGIQAIVNLIQGGRVSSAWIVLVVFVVVGVAVNGILQIFQLRITENLQQKIFARSSFELAYRMPRIKLSELIGKYAPELANRFFDTITIQKGIAKILIQISTAALQVIFGLILLSLYHEFFVIFSIFLIVMLVAIFRYFGPRGIKTSLNESNQKYKTAYWLEEVARTHKTFKLAGDTSLPFTRVDQHVNNYIEARESHFKVLIGQYASLVVFKVIVAAGLLAIGGVLVMEQVMNIGQFVAAEIIILLIISSVEKLITSLDTIYDVLTGMEKIGLVTDLELEKSEGLDLNKECQDLNALDIDIDKAYFTYPKTGREVIKNVRLSIKGGEHIMIAGKNESGKSALIELMAGMYDLNQGVISYQGFPIENLNIETLRGTIGTCLATEELFHATLLENITLGRDGATFDRVKFVCDKLGINEFIKRLPQGFETMLDPGSDILPEAIIYMVLIARAIVDSPKVVLFEYTFEHFDDEQKEKIVSFLLDKSNGWTFITSSNDPYLAKRCDRVVIMSGGRIRQIGDYDQVKDEL
jgi:ABC-type bacteriocin/lantibiotic exporter with double-glycine peptidase domain